MVPSKSLCRLRRIRSHYNRHGIANIKSLTFAHVIGSKENYDSDDDDEGHSGLPFKSLNLHAGILGWLRKKKITRMTRVQSMTIEPFLRGTKDVLVQSCTGSGKTLCFVIPMLQMFLNYIYDTKITSKHNILDVLDVFAVLLFPTRELAIQVGDLVLDASAHLVESPDTKPGKTHTFSFNKWTLYCSILIGGCSVENDVKHLKNAAKKKTKAIVIATPGRLNHMMNLLSQDVWVFANLKMLVLDEVDRLLELGYQDDIQGIVSRFSKQRKTGLFSATLGNEIIVFAKYLVSDSIVINADINNSQCRSDSGDWIYGIPDRLNNVYCIVDVREKLTLVISMLQDVKKNGATKCAIFFLTCDLVDYYAPLLKLMLGPCGFEVYKAHRKMVTKARKSAISKFKETNSNTFHVLVCTDLFSRGIDVPKIDWVIQFDPPQDPNFFIHRVGRVSRAGAFGNALLLLQPAEEAYIEFQRNRKVELQPLSHIPEAAINIPNFEETSVFNKSQLYSDFLASRSPDHNTVYDWKLTCRLLSFLRTRISQNRLVLESASKAFVSYTRAYSEHHLKCIFTKNLDYGAIAASMGVLRVPRVKEIMGKRFDNFANSDIDPESVAYLDQEKEKKRQMELEKAAAMRLQQTVVHAKPGTNPKQPKRSRSDKRKAKREADYSEWNEFAREEALVKKLKKGRIKLEKYTELLDQDDDWEAELNNFNSKAFKRMICGGRKK
ncbi:bifunctional P-loop containing nucleoside triphosphate hydrolase/Helicase [Babesia duncani]|uniref:ATP-dependent RNA helicase n=1 Tax=Babesia duncani TaxID=323732 RepID=A0AAD9PLJ2_9APIC|nr:bifunctional P-loop containing nucleoside triphosphate hydrolase/Helicase [Babesia duncani]